MVTLKRGDPNEVQLPWKVRVGIKIASWSLGWLAAVHELFIAAEFRPLALALILTLLGLPLKMSQDEKTL